MWCSLRHVHIQCCVVVGWPCLSDVDSRANGSKLPKALLSKQVRNLSGQNRRVRTSKANFQLNTAKWWIWTIGLSWHYKHHWNRANIWKNWLITFNQNRHLHWLGETSLTFYKYVSKGLGYTASKTRVHQALLTSIGNFPTTDTAVPKCCGKHNLHSGHPEQREPSYLFNIFTTVVETPEVFFLHSV